ncbi:MAG: hypothetical protein H6502_01845 [Candidatus Woesearchaeota archaeon]|nr:MAG: hypothetical protein H6502_01845 [Candidatus Woesearchaeota archaeon]
MVSLTERSGDQLVDLALDTIANDKQILVFAPTKASAEAQADAIASQLDLLASCEELSENILKAVSSPTKQCKRLSKVVHRGVAFHHSGLHSAQRSLVESAFKDKRIKVICATPTLAAGLNLPAFRVVIKSLRRYGARGLYFIPVLEALQMMGRAGRPGKDDFGEAILLADSSDQKELLHDKYLLGVPEDIDSKLAVEPVLRMYVLSLVASGMVFSQEEVKDFFSETFYADQYGDDEAVALKIEKIIGELELWGFLVASASSDAKGFQSASSLLSSSPRKLEATPLGKRVAELYLDPYSAKLLLDALSLLSDDPSPFSLLQALMKTKEIRPLLRVRTKELEQIEKAIVAHDHEFVFQPPSMYDHEYAEFLDGMKTTLVFLSWIEEVGEDILLDEFGLRPGELHFKRETIDWLLYALKELSQLTKRQHLIKHIERLRVRLSYGVKEELLALLRLKQVGRVRARILFRNGLKTVGDLKKIDPTSLSSLVGPATARVLKEQVGEPMPEVVKKNKRKGQINLDDFQSTRKSTQ